MQNLNIPFYPDNGKVPRHISLEVKEYVQLHKDDHLYIKIGKVKKYRTGNQNSYYHGVVIPGIIRVFYKHGDLIDEAYAHDFAKRELGNGIFESKISNMTGEIIIESSANLDTIKWETWMTNIRRWAAEEDVQIKEPNEDKK